MLKYEEQFINLGLKISYYRRKKKYTQAQLAQILGISESYLSQLERGCAQGAPLALYWDLCAALCVDFSDLLKEI